MTTILTLIVLTTCLTSTSFGAPQLFPFSNLKSYFEHQIKDGPSSVKFEGEGDTNAQDNLEEQSEVVEVPVLLADGRKLENFPKNHRPSDTNYKPVEAAPVFEYQPSFPAQVLKAPAAGEPVNYALLLEKQKPQEPIIPATILLPPSTDNVPDVVQFLPPVPSQELQTPPLPQESLLPTSLQTPQTSDVLLEPSFGEHLSPTKTNKDTNQNIYPKKYKSNHKYPSSSDSEINNKKKNPLPKKEISKQTKEQEQYKQQRKQQQNIAATVEAASFQTEALSKIVPTPEVLKVTGTEEQVAAETGFSGISSGAAEHGLGLGGGHGDRVEFQMHGQHGPHSYKWGYDTGKGHNRQFRYEERDTHGHVKGHYGFYDKSGKLQVVNYSADPHNGFHADGNFGKHSIA